MTFANPLHREPRRVVSQFEFLRHVIASARIPRGSSVNPRTALCGRPHPSPGNRSSVSAICVSTTTITQAEPHNCRSRHFVLPFANHMTETRKKTHANRHTTAKAGVILRSLFDPYLYRGDAFGRAVAFLAGEHKKLELRQYPSETKFAPRPRFIESRRCRLRLGASRFLLASH